MHSLHCCTKYFSRNTKHLGVHVKCQTLLSNFNQIWTFSTYPPPSSHRNPPKLNFTKIRPVGAAVIKADRQRRSDMAKLIKAFHLKHCRSITNPWQCYVPLWSCRFTAYLPIQLQNWSLTAIHISITITPAQKRVGRPGHRTHQPRLLHFGGARFIPDNHNYIYIHRGAQFRTPRRSSNSNLYGGAQYCVGPRHRSCFVSSFGQLHLFEEKNCALYSFCTV